MAFNEAESAKLLEVRAERSRIHTGHARDFVRGATPVSERAENTEVRIRLPEFGTK